MSNELVRKSLETTLKVKSLNDLIRVKTNDTAVLLLDVSGSMKELLRNGKKRIDGVREVVRSVQAEQKVEMIAFGGYSPDGLPAYVVTSVPHPAGGTPLHSAIDLARTRGASHAVVISDGIPDNVSLAMEAAKLFGGKIDVVFVGNPGEYGELFLKDLAASTGGTEFHGDLGQPKELGGAIMGLLGGASEDDEDEKKAVQL